MTSDNNLLFQIRAMDQDMERLIGRRVFGHIAQPTPTSLWITFADAHVALSMPEAYEYMTALLTTAQSDPTRLPWPLCEPV